MENKKINFIMAPLSEQEKKRLMLVLTVLVVLAFCSFAFLYIHTHSTMKAVDASAWGANTGEHYCGVDEVGTHHVDYIFYSDYVKLTGWALKNGQTIGTNNAKFVLQDVNTGIFYELPTACTERADVEEMMSDDCDYTACGLESVIKADELTADYRIYIHYCNDGNDVLIDTGKLVSEFYAGVS
jgi:hypothetical protein